MPAKKNLFSFYDQKEHLFTMKLASIFTTACLLLAMAVTTPIVVDGGKKSIVGCQEVIILK